MQKISKILRNTIMTRPILIDTDPGCDDMLAILMALKDPQVSVKGISLVAGNTRLRNMPANVERIFRLADLDPQTYPKVCKGANEPIMGDIYKKSPRCQYYVNETDGLGNQPDLEPKKKDNLEAENLICEKNLNGAEGIIKMSREFENQLEIVALAPLTNLALAYKLDNSLPSRLKKLHIMGGNHVSGE